MVMFKIPGIPYSPDVEVSSGEKVVTAYPVAHKVLSDVTVPLIVANGVTPGPVLMVYAGAHPCEYDSIDAAFRVGWDVDPKKLKGTLIVVPVINVIDFELRKPYTYLIYGSKSPGSVTNDIYENINYNIFNNLLMNAQYLINMHGVDLAESMEDPLVYLPIHGTKEFEELDKKAIEMAKVFCYAGIENIEVTRPLGEIFDKERGQYRPAKPPSLLAQKGIPEITPQAGTYPGRVTKQHSDKLYDGCFNVMKWLGMLKGDVVRKLKEEPKFFEVGRGCYYAYMKPQLTGLWYNLKCAGENVKKGEVLAELKDWKTGKVLNQVISPTDGKITGNTQTLPWKAGPDGGGPSSNGCFVIFNFKEGADSPARV